MGKWDKYAEPTSGAGKWDKYAEATPSKDVKSIPAADSSDSFSTKALDAVGTQMQMASDAVVAGVDSIPGIGYVKKGMAAIAAPLKGQTYEETADGYNQDIKDRWERNPTHALGGSLLFGSKIPNVAGNGAVSRIAQNTGVAALDALGRDKAGLNTDSVANASKVTAGVGLATELPGLAGKAAKAINPEKIADSLETFANNKAVKALNPILSQQERLDNRGMTQKLGKELLDKKIVKFGSSVDDMLPRVEKMLSDKGDEIGALRKGADELGAKVDLRELEHEAIRRLDAAKGMGTDAESYANAFAKEVENITSNPTRNISDTGDLLGELGKAGKYNRVSAPVKADAVRDVRSMVKTLSDEATANVSKPIHDQHNDAREVFSLLKSGEEILDKSTARGAKNASIGLRDTIFGASGMSKDGSMSESSLRAAAIMMASKLIRERGNASAAVLAKKLADFARSSSGKLPGSSFNGAGTTLDKVTSQAKVTLSKMAGDKVYEAITGDEEMPDPIKDKAVQYLTEKYNLSPTEQKVLRRLVPGVYDMAGMVKGKMVNKVYQNTVAKSTKGIEVSGTPFSSRKVKTDDGTFTHEIYRDRGKLIHVLRDATHKPIAQIEGNIINYNGDKGFAVSWSQSSTQGKGDGKRLYDLALDTHGKLFSDQSLSPDGSHKVYADHFPNRPGVGVDLADWDTPNRHVVSTDGSESLRKDLKAGVVPKKTREYFDKFDPESSEVVQTSTERASQQRDNHTRLLNQSLSLAQIALNNGRTRASTLRTVSDLPAELQARFRESLNNFQVSPNVLSDKADDLNVMDLFKAVEGHTFQDSPHVQKAARERLMSLAKENNFIKNKATTWAEERVAEGMDDGGYWKTFLDTMVSARAGHDQQLEALLKGK